MLPFGELFDYPDLYAFDSIALRFPFEQLSQPEPNDHLAVFRTALRFLRTLPSQSSMKEHDQLSIFELEGVNSFERFEYFPL